LTYAYGVIYNNKFMLFHKLFYFKSEISLQTFLLTDLGKEVLNKEVERLESLLRDAEYAKGGNEDEFQNRD